MSRLTLDLSKDVDNRLTEIAKREGISKAEAMRRAFALLAMADTEKSKGNSLGIVRETQDDPSKFDVLGRVVGI
ncbi:ribbon-helix-helix protein, CopG family [Kordiimonas sp.]|uniref:ribbon-helix-helix protein, CopG family n=1 Tax=Kordiimonas sp. TaxID=1970157 RepID=UPI003A90D889